MAYSELVKNFERIREYMREFYVYGFKSRDEYSLKSARSYDNERRRIESWLGDYMSFRHTDSGKNVFISVDSRDIDSNPLYNALKAKSFTDNDIVLFFFVIDLLADGTPRTAAVINDAITDIYLARIKKDAEFDLSTLRKKLKEFEQLGIIKSKKNGNKQEYTCIVDNDSESVLETVLMPAIEFYSEEAPLGVIGSFIQDRRTGTHDNSINEETCLLHKHHYILAAIDSEIMFQLVRALREHRALKLSAVSRRRYDTIRDVCPIKIYASTQQGRYYLLGYNYKHGTFHFVRIDSIRSVEILHVEPNFERYQAMYLEFRKNLWGVSTNRHNDKDHIERAIVGESGEHDILDRLEREKRCGSVLRVNESCWRYTADVYDALEMLPWIRTFTGRISRLVCSNEAVAERFYEELAEMRKMYGGDGHAFS